MVTENLDLRDLSQKVRDVVKEAGKKAYMFQKEKIKAQKKADGTEVTEADIVIEADLKRKLGDLVPNSYFIGEETSGDIDQDTYRHVFEHDYVWTIDPVDGTYNFAEGKPYFAVSVGLLQKTPEGYKPVLGAICMPRLNELTYTDGETVFQEDMINGSVEEVRPREHNGISELNLNVTDSFFNRYKIKSPEVSKRVQKLRCTVANVLETALGQAQGTTTSAHIWDFVGALAIAQRLGVDMRDFETGQVKDAFTLDDFVIGDPKKDWKLKRAQVVSTEDDYQRIKEEVIPLYFY